MIKMGIYQGQKHIRENELDIRTLNPEHQEKFDSNKLTIARMLIKKYEYT